MRVVAGALGGRSLKGPEGVDARPTMDKVRAAIFNSLTSLGELQGASVVDLFAGTGAFGIEAMSRGAQRAEFVEKSAKNAALIRENLASVNLEAQVHVQDVMTWLKGNKSFDIAFIDPPYVFEEWVALLQSLQAGIAVCESDRPVDASNDWSVLRSKKYGGTYVTMLQRVHPA
jgi:16S rRNA (guanine966-N2)-methyltransferase